MPSAHHKEHAGGEVLAPRPRSCSLYDKLNKLRKEQIGMRMLTETPVPGHSERQRRFRRNTSAAADMNLQVIVSQERTLHTSRRNFILLTLVLIYCLTLM